MDLSKENKFHSYDMNDTKLLGRLTGDAKPMKWATVRYFIWQ